MEPTDYGKLVFNTLTAMNKAMAKALVKALGDPEVEVCMWKVVRYHSKPSHADGIDYEFRIQHKGIIRCWNGPIDPIHTYAFTFCPFCGKRIRVEK